MGSAFAGVKAGIIAGVCYAGVIGFFNLMLINVFKPQILSSLSAFSECSGAAAGAPVATPQECFAAISVVYLPYVLFLIFIFSLIFASIFGAYFDRIPLKNHTMKAFAVSLILYVILFATGYFGVWFDFPSFIIASGFALIATVFYAVLLARFYRRYTRSVEFSTQEPGMLRIILDKRDVTGKVRTLAVGSSHRIRASTTGGVHFKEWSFSGGVTVDDTHSFESSLMINGDGLLKASFV